MIKVFKPYNTTVRETSLHGDIAQFIGVDGKTGEEREALIRERLKECDVLQADVNINVNKELLKDAPNVRAVLCTSIGTDYVNLAEMTELGIPVANNPDFCVEAVAEFAIGLMMSVIRCIPRAHHGVIDDNWMVRRYTGGIEILNSTLGLVGFGRIGREVARMARGLGMKVVATDAYMTPETIASYGVTPATLEEVYEASDVISIHVPLTDETRGMIGRAAFEKMKDGVYLINVSRGEIINEKDLAEAVLAGKFRGVGLDVMEKEPPLRDNPLLSMTDQNVVLTPHTAWYSFKAQTNADECFRSQLIDISEGRIPRAVVNKDVLSNPRVKQWFDI